jgi:hypothetical protein
VKRNNAASAVLLLAMIPIGIPMACAEHKGTTLSFSPSSLSFTMTAGSTTSQQQTVSVTSSRSMRFSVSVSGSSGGVTWLSVSPSGTLSTPQTLTVSVRASQLPAGTYSGAVNISSSSGSSSIPVQLTVSSNQGLTATPSSLSFSGTVGGSSPAAQNVSIAASPNVTFTAVASGGSWLTVSPTTGTTPASLSVKASLAPLAAGTYSGSVAISGGGRTVTVLVTFTVNSTVAGGGSYKLVGWNDLGMHCFDGKDYSVFGVLPPYNTIHAHLINTNGSLVTSPSTYKVTYSAIADPMSNSINSTSAPKTNFWTYVSQLGLGSPIPDEGIAGYSMPGTSNTPQSMAFSTTDNTFLATGIPITPYADNGKTNYFPMMRLTATDNGGTVLATTDIVLPTSDEMNCAKCHASNTNPAAMPSAGWANDPDPARDTKLNILRKHDDRFQSTSQFQSAATQVGYNPAGLVTTVASKRVLCAQCHGSNALSMAGVSGIETLTTAMHTLHASVTDPSTGAAMNSGTTRATCYSCHPGVKTQCLRGAMGTLKTSSGSNAMECQSCHGSMTAVANPARQGWLNEPTCQSCHSGLASASNTTLAYTSVFTSGTTMRTPADRTFATNANTPSTGLSLYRFSSGHGGLQCEACHGSTHAEFPTSVANDNVQSINLQGHAGMLSECSTCHATVPTTTNGGPHGLHPIGSTWVSQHQNVAETQGTAACQGCHGTDYRGTILSRVQANRTMAGRSFTAGTIIGCYSCHNGPNGGD